MNKKNVNMKNWELYIDSNNYNLSGIADNHPKLGKNAYVAYTSSLVNSSFKDDILMYETKNTIYICPLKYMNIYPYYNVTNHHKKELTHIADQVDNMLNRIIAASAKISIINTNKENNNTNEVDITHYSNIENIDDDYSDDKLVKHIMKLQEQGQKEIEAFKEKENNRLIEIASTYEDCIYIEISNVGYGNTLAYHLGKFKGVVKPEIHLGFVRDSVLYMKYESVNDPCSLDFRYFPLGIMNDTIKTYSWSDNIVQAIIKNDTNYTLTFNQKKIPVGETMIFTPKDHRQGLISPDCHNGKSLLGNKSNPEP